MGTCWLAGSDLPEGLSWSARLRARALVKLLDVKSAGKGASLEARALLPPAIQSS